MFAEETVYVNELCLTDVPDSERHTYSFDAHAVEHVENVLCRNISRWALSIRATSQASYCRIHHTDPHLQKHPQTQGLCSGTVQELQCCHALLLCSTCVFQLLGKNCSLMSQRMSGHSGRTGQSFHPLALTTSATVLNVWHVCDSLGYLCFISTAVSFHRTFVATKEYWKKVPQVPEKDSTAEGQLTHSPRQL